MPSRREFFVSPDSSVLVQVAQKVDIEELNKTEMKSDIDRMLLAALGEQKDPSKPLLVGLAAPQIGISRRIILVDVKADGKGVVGDLRTYVNPEIVWKSSETSEWYEGCYSTDRVCGVVSRPNKIKVKALALDGKVIEEEHEGYAARIFQHEIDHLDGIEFVTHINDDDKLDWVEDDQFPEYRNNEGWRNWPNKCPRERWERIKGIRK